MKRKERGKERDRRGGGGGKEGRKEVRLKGEKEGKEQLPL